MNIYVQIHLSEFFCPSFSSPLRSSSLPDKREEFEGIWAVVISKVRGIGGSSSRKAKGKVTLEAGVINFVAPVENHPFLLKSTYISVYFNFVARQRASFSLENDMANLNARELDPTRHLEERLILHLINELNQIAKLLHPIQSNQRPPIPQQATLI